MLKPFITRRFKKDFKRFEHNKSVKIELDAVMGFLLKGKKLPEKYFDHPLSGSYGGTRECHLKPDVLFIYWTDDVFVQLYRIGSAFRAVLT
jgi:mRNA interferase YafQ